MSLGSQTGSRNFIGMWLQCGGTDIGTVRVWFEEGADGARFRRLLDRIREPLEEDGVTLSIVGADVVKLRSGGEAGG